HLWSAGPEFVISSEASEEEVPEESVTEEVSDEEKEVPEESVTEEVSDEEKEVPEESVTEEISDEQEVGSEEIVRDDDIGRIVFSYAGHSGVDVESRGIGIREEFEDGRMHAELDFRGYAVVMDEALAVAWAPDSSCIASIGKGKQWHIWEPDGHHIGSYPVPPNDNVKSEG